MVVIKGIKFSLLSENNSATIQGLKKRANGKLVIPSFVQTKCKMYQVVDMKESAFAYNLVICEIQLPSLLTRISDKAFYFCQALSRVVLPESITKIGKRAFDECQSLREITLPSKITKIESKTFGNCDELEYVYLPSNINQIDNEAFYRCSQLGFIDLPENLRVLGNKVFIMCRALKNVNLPNRLQKIGNGTFSGCSSLITITLPVNLKSIGSAVFCGCYQLSNIICKATIPPICNDYTFSGFNKDQCVVYVPAGTINAYKVALGWKDFINIQEKSIEELTLDGIIYTFDYATMMCYAKGIANKTCTTTLQLKSKIEIHDSSYPVTSIGNHAFYNAHFSTINLSNSINVIEEFAFYRSKLTSIIIPESVTRIGRAAFRKCESLKVVTFIGTRIEYIGKEAFSECLLESIKLPEGIFSIQEAAFAFNGKLTTISLPSTLRFMDRGAFDGTILKKIFCLSEIPPTCPESSFWGFDYTSCILYVPHDAIVAYKYATGWEYFPHIEAIPNEK